MEPPPPSLPSGIASRISRLGWRRLTGGSLLVAVSAWALLALAAWLFVKYRRDFPDVSYLDLFWPGRWPQYRQRQGDHYIAQSAALLRAGDYNLAVHKLRVGVAKSPANPQGRYLLARVYLAYRRPDLAKDVLFDGLSALGGDPAYLQITLAFLLETQEDAALLELTRRELADPGRRAVRPLLATFAATAAYYRGNYDAAEDLIGQYHLRDSADGVVLLARMAWDRGYGEAAIAHLKGHLLLHPQHDAVRALLVGYYLQLGRTDEWEAALVERIARDPQAPAPRVASLQLHHRRGDLARLEQEASSFLQQFARDPAALLLLADFAANTGRPALARRVQQALATYPEQAGAAALMTAEAHIAAGEYQPALALVSSYARSYPEWVGQFAPVFNGLQAVALSGLGRSDEARLHLDHLLAQKNLRAENLVAVADRLSALGARDLAVSALGRAVEADPLNQAALANLIRLELDSPDLRALPGHLDKFLRLRLPSREVLLRARAALGSDRWLLLPEQQPLLASLQVALARR